MGEGKGTEDGKRELGKAEIKEGRERKKDGKGNEKGKE